MSIPIVVVEVILDLKIPAEDQIQMLREALERQKIINSRWLDTGSGPGWSPEDGK